MIDKMKQCGSTLNVPAPNRKVILNASGVGSQIRKNSPAVDRINSQELDGMLHFFR